MSFPVTLDALRAAAKAIPEQLPYQQWLNQPGSEWHQAERAQAAFWRLAFMWEHQQNFAPYDIEEEYLEGHAIIAEVEART